MQFSSVAQSCPTLCDPMNCNTPDLPDHHQLPEFTQTHVHRVGDAIQPSHPCRPLLLLAPIPPRIRVSSNDYSGLISFRMNWFDLLAVQRTFQSLLLHHSMKASILQYSAFFMIQLSHPYMTTRNTIALTIWTLSAQLCLCILIHCLDLS